MKVTLKGQEFSLVYLWHYKLKQEAKLTLPLIFEVRVCTHPLSTVKMSLPSTIQITLLGISLRFFTQLPRPKDSL